MLFSDQMSLCCPLCGGMRALACAATTHLSFCCTSVRITPMILMHVDRAQASRPTSRRPPRGWVETADASTQTLSFVPEPSTAESDRADILRICKLRYVEPISLPHVAASESDEYSAGDESDHAAASGPLPAAPACSDSADDDGGAPGPSGRQPWRPEPRDERARLRFELESDSSFA